MEPSKDVADCLGLLGWCDRRGSMNTALVWVVRCGQKFVPFNEVQGLQCLEQLGGEGSPV